MVMNLIIILDIEATRGARADTSAGGHMSIVELAPTMRSSGRLRMPGARRRLVTDRLTKREMKVLGLIADGLSNRAVAGGSRCAAGVDVDGP